MWLSEVSQVSQTEGTRFIKHLFCSGPYSSTTHYVNVISWHSACTAEREMLR
jgi:hypothetical protein